ncbi:MAG: hypothetical protein AB7Q81_10435 [Gammaproteobacteria bacterium]
MSHLGVVALLVVLGAIARWFQLAWAVRIPRSPTPFMVLWGLGAVLAAIALLTHGDAAAGWALALGLLMLYLGATGTQRTAGDAIAVGAHVPAFTGTDEHGRTFDSATLAGQRFLLKFFRGHW